MQNIRLLVNLYLIDEGKRLDELILCLKNNIANPLISEIVVLDEGFPKPELFDNPKVTVLAISARPDFADFYDHLDPDGINILSNNDIRFDQSLKKLSLLNPGPYDLLTLTRREADGKLYKAEQADAQDSWIFVGKAAPLKDCTFPMGIPGCENRLAFLFFAKQYRVLNPAKIIRTHHEHTSQQRGYQNAERIDGHYLLTRPVGLIGFHFYRMVLRMLQRTRILRVKDIGSSR